MFLATAFLYPCVLAALCLGAGLLVDRVSARTVPRALLLPVGAAGLIAVSQLTTFLTPLAPATPYVMAAVALTGLLLGRGELRPLLGRVRAQPWLPAASVAAYALALAPVLAAGRPTFSSFMALSDSAVHLIGADYLISHGQSYAHLDLGNSYGQFINAYYNTSYPSGADTLFGGSAILIGLPLIWAFQPFNAFMLASACGPAWLLARRLGLAGPLAALAALTVVLPALVYAYELIGSVKEVTSVPMLLAAGCLVSSPRAWLHRGARAVIPLALVLAGGISALGAAFGVWALVALAVLLAAVVVELRARRLGVGEVLAGAGVGALVGLVAALPTWADLGGSLRTAGAIASTSNPGNLSSPLRAVQALGVWLNGSYKLEPRGGDRVLTTVLIAIALLAVLLGCVQLIRRRAWALGGWIALMLLAWLVVSQSVTTWASAKTLMLTSPVVVLLAWGGVALLRSRPSGAAALAAAGLALVLAGAVLVSDEMQYRSSNLAPTARYEELDAVSSRFAGRGPALVTDFDEYSMYVLRDLDVGGPDFVFPPPAAAAAAGGYGRPVELGRIAPRALLDYPLIVTRRDPGAPRPPAAYSLAWAGNYYEVWQRGHGAPAASVHAVLAGSPAQQCTAIGMVASKAATGDTLAAAEAPPLVRAPLEAARAPAGWARRRQGFVMGRAGTLATAIRLPAGGRWELWLQGQFMPRVSVAVDGRRLASVAGQLSGNSLVPGSAPPIAATLSAGDHRLTLERPAATLAPGSAGAAVLDAVLLTPAGSEPVRAVRSLPASSWRQLCGRRYEWVELIPAGTTAVSLRR
jgi:hypothetical protein